MQDETLKDNITFAKFKVLRLFVSIDGFCLSVVSLGESRGSNKCGHFRLLFCAARQNLEKPVRGGLFNKNSKRCLNGLMLTPCYQ